MESILWSPSVKKIDDKTCEFTNMVHSAATPELMDFLGKQGISGEVFQAARKPVSEAHNRQEPPLFAKSIEPSRLEAKVIFALLIDIRIQRDLTIDLGDRLDWREHGKREI